MCAAPRCVSRKGLLCGRANSVVLLQSRIPVKIRIPTQPSAKNHERDIFSDEFLEESDTQLPESDPPKELILNLERRGHGWGEEIVPYVTVQWRPIRKTTRVRIRSQGPSPWEEGSIESELARAGVPKDAVEKVIAAAAAWRVTPRGRPLIDRRRRARAQRNAAGVIKHLNEVCGVPLGLDGVAKILMKAPQILLAKVTAANPWGLRAIELAGFMYLYGHCSVPEDWSVSPALREWVRRQRELYERRDLNAERVQILHALGFCFESEKIGVDREWKAMFTAYENWIHRMKEVRRSIDESGLTWIHMGGWRAARLAVWAISQRQRRRNNSLLDANIQRLDALNFRWNVQIEDHYLSEWMSKFGELVVAVETHKTFSRRDTEFSSEFSSHLKSPSLLSHDMDDGMQFWQPASAQRFDWWRQPVDKISAKTGIPKLDQMRNLSLSQEIELWLEEQRCLWRRDQLPLEKIALLYALGIDLNTFSQREWVESAHLAAKFLNNFEIDVHENEHPKEEIGLLDAWPRMLVRPQNIVSISRLGDIMERVDLNTFRTMRDEVNVISMEPATATATMTNGLTHTTHEKISGTEHSHRGMEMDATTPVAVREWVLTQTAMWKEDRLTKRQRQYLSILGLTWILHNEIVEIDDEAWWSYFEKIQSTSLDELPMQLQEFLFYQRALHRIGFLGDDRRDALTSIGFSFEFDERTQREIEWDRNISHLLKCTSKSCQQKIDWDSQSSQWLTQQEKKMKSLTRLKRLQIRTLREQLL